MALSRTLKCMKTERWPLRGAFLPQGRQLWEQPWPAWQDEVIKKKDKQAKSDRYMLNASGSIGWISFVRNSRFCLGPHTWGRSLKSILAPFSHSESSFWETPKIIIPISPISCWLLLLAFFDFPSYWLSSIPLVIVVFYCCLSLLLVISNAVGYHHYCWLSSMLLVIIVVFYCWPTQLLVIIVSSLRNHFLLFFFTNFIRLVSSMPLLSIFRGMRRNEIKREIMYIIFICWTFDQDLKVLMSNRLQRSSSPLPCLIFVF